MMSSKRLFESATIRLTLWYMVILMTISLLFSVVLYRVASDEFGRALGPRRPGETRIFIDDDTVVTLRQQRIQDSNARLLSNLIVFNIVVLLGGGGASYLLAKRTLRPIRQALESQARFSSDAAHELRTPLAVIQTETEVALRDRKATKASYGKILQSNLDEVNRLRILTDRLLMLANNHDIPCVPVSLDDIASDAMNRSISAAQHKDITIDNQVGPVTAMANAESLVDVVAILIDNAIKYSPEKRTVTLTSEVRDKQVLLHVRDQGIGIAAHDLPHIFDRFYRADTSRSKMNVEGFGLGLSIARRSIELQHGELSVQSTIGNGSTFTIQLPKA